MNKKNIKKILETVIQREQYSSLMRLGIPQPSVVENHFIPEMMDLIRYNPNNIGTTTRMKTAKNSCREIEKRLVTNLGEWFGEKNVDGYVTSGSTEGNIMGLWIAREKLKKYGKPIVVAHSESHYSINKACNLLGLDLVRTDPEGWKKSLCYEMIDSLDFEVDRPVICVATIGHTSTGLIDDVKSIVKYLKKNHKHYYIHLDAAVGGLFAALGEKNIASFLSKEVESLTFDFHKYGLFYYPSGVFLCRKDLQDNIKSLANYISIFDDTLIGSRSGTIPAIMWANLELLKKKGISKRLASIIKNKEKFIQKLEDKKISYIAEDCMPVVCVFLPNRLSEQVELEYRLHHTKRKEGFAYTIFFYPKYTRTYDKLLKHF